MIDKDIVAQYDVYCYDDSETIHDYIGNNLDEAIKSFEMLKSIHTNKKEIDVDITIVLYDNWNEKIVSDYNTLRDA
ncbi:MAG: hypothetical protein J6M39_06575 [Lachnospiraceae bacterium]|nr:hypothetical protein [Lachnospiraceae bacterium]